MADSVDDELEDDSELVADVDADVDGEVDGDDEIDDVEDSDESDDDDDAEDEEAEDEEADGDDEDGAVGGRGRASGSNLLVQEGDIAADYLERLLDIVDYDGDIDLDVENGRAIVAIVGADLKPLIGAKGEALDALQELTRLAVQQRTGARSRLMLDIGGYRAARRETLQVQAREAADRVLADKADVRLSPMNPFERKVVHDTISDIAGVHSASEGEEPQRRVIVSLGDA
jgi:spoIIIJ-associated protein